MKVFISWSGDPGKQVAEELGQWLRGMLPTVEPYVSSRDTTKGGQWFAILSAELGAARYAIICATRDALESAYVHFEVGALYQSLGQSRIAPFLFGLGEDDLTLPLAEFQSTRYERNDVLALVKDINLANLDMLVLSEQAVEEAFDRQWPELAERLDALADSLTARPSAPADRPGELLSEILGLIKVQHRLLSDPARLIPAEYIDAVIRDAASAIGPDLRADFEKDFGALLHALDQHHNAADPAVNEIAGHAARLQNSYQRMTERRPHRNTLRSRFTDRERRQAAGDD